MDHANEGKGLESVFERKESEQKKSKTRKRIANNAKVKKVREDETEKMTMDD